MRRFWPTGPLILVLDLMLPGENDLELCRRSRVESNVAVRMLMALGVETDRVVGLEWALMISHQAVQ
jgi:DNA-binding response OmpR family regulator